MDTHYIFYYNIFWFKIQVVAIFDLEALEISVDKAADFAAQNSVGVGFFVAGAGIFDETIWLEDVVSDLLAPAGGFTSAELADRGGVLFELHLDEFAAENFHGFLFVLELGALVLDCDDGVGREVGDADGGVGRVDGLAAMTAGMIDVDTEVFFVDFDVRISFDNRENFDESERSLAKVVCIEWRETDQAMNAMLGFQGAIGVWARDFVDTGFDTRFLAFLALDLGGLEAALLSESQIHAFEHAGPVHSFGSADTGSYS